MSQAVKKLVRNYTYTSSAEYRYFLYDPCDDMRFFKTVSERDDAASDSIDAHCDDGWDEEVSGVCVGEVTHHAARDNVVMKPNSKDFDSEEEYDDACCEFGSSDGDYTCNYSLKPIEVTDEPVVWPVPNQRAEDKT